MSESSKKFLVTGATGKTGAYVVAQLCERGEQVRACWVTAASKLPYSQLQRR